MHSLRAGRRSVARRSSRRVAMGVAAALTLMSGSAAVANAAVARAAARPVLNAHGHKLTWPAAAKVSKYVLATSGHGKTTHASYRVLKGTSFTPPSVAGQTMSYQLRANTSASRWSKTVSIKYSAKPATTPATPAKAASAPAKVASAPAAAAPAAPVVTAPAAPVTPAAVTSSSMMVGLNSGWGTTSASQMQGNFGLARIDTSEGGTETPSTYHADGIKVIATFPGDVGGGYNAGGVSAINIPNWVSMATSYYANQCMGSTDYCPAIEVLNEPYGSWFWGANAADAQNEAAYANLVKSVHEAFQAKYGADAPKILAAYDKNSGWWAGMVAAVPNITSYFDGVVVHPYGGTGSAASSALGNHALVTQAHNDTGKPDWITEFGWPTAVGQPATGDSLQWTQSQQATNIYNFITWARSTGYVSALTYFNYRDYGTNNWYGVENGAGTKKLGWTALTESAASQACTVCS